MEYKNSTVEYLINEWVHSERDRKIMKRRLIDGVIFEALAEELDMSVTQVKRIVAREQPKIFAHYPTE